MASASSPAAMNATALHPALGSASEATAASPSAAALSPDRGIGVSNPLVDLSSSTAISASATSTSTSNPPLSVHTRPKTSSQNDSRLSVNVARAEDYGVSDNSPRSAVPALGRDGAAYTSLNNPDAAYTSLNNSDAAAPASFRPAASSHRRNNQSDTIPRQTIIKALASVARNNKPEALSLNSMLSAQNSLSAAADDAAATGGDHQALPSSAASSQKLADALNDLALRRSNFTPTTALPALQSPCFYHQRFDDAVNIDKVLEEIKNDDAMSHSRLVRTATGVREVSKQLQRRPIRRAVKNVMIVTKARDNQLVHLTRELATWLLATPRYGSDLGVNVYVDAKLRNSKRFNARGITAENDRFQDMLRYWTPDLCWSQPDKFDLVLTLGGDGTVLFTSWLFQRVVPPILSFSLGSLGFMTTFEFEKYKEHLTRVMGDDGMKVNLRMRFTCTVWRANGVGGEMDEGEQFEVLNELVIDRGPSPYVSNLELYGDDELLTVVQADGCIFSTPTGSTAYSLSAGGSLVHPDIPAILLTPICPHTLSFRPMVLSDTMALRVAVPRGSRATAYCAFDGKGRIELRQGDHVTISASQYPFPTVTRTDTEWFDSVSRTLRWNVRAAAQKPFDAGAVPKDGEDDELSWDIDTDSAYYASEEGSVSASPVRRQMSLLGL
ncbi:ATP-NAD kinase domain-containing protein [Sarocladium implicatum]|nr:ATP-NAD kinase domain-containing protein [Sarocladium implicatum]